MQVHPDRITSYNVCYTKLLRSQANAIERFVDFLLREDESLVFLLKGYAGTGKTYLVSSFVSVLESLQYHQVLMAPTGRAAKVFSGYSKKQAFTIHKAIYRQKSANDGFGSFNLNKNLKRNNFV